MPNDHTGPLEKHVRIEATADEPLTRGIVRDRHEVFIDESAELPVGGGNDEYPSAVDLMLTSLAACQVSVLQQCLEKARIERYHIEADAEITGLGDERIPDEMPPNTANRVQHIDVDLSLTVPQAYESRASRCVDVYDKGCIVGQSFRAGIEYTPDTSITVSSTDELSG